MMDNGLMIQGDADIYALEFAAPATLMIQMSDRQPEKKPQALETITDISMCLSKDIVSTNNGG